MMENENISRSRSRSRDRRSNHDSDEGQAAAEVRRPYNDDRGESRTNNRGGDGGNNLYITNLSFQTTEDSLRAFFKVLGEVSNASVVREPQTQSSRGFGFVSFVDNADSERAVLELSGKELDSRIIRVEKARRASGYEKTPGRYLGPPQVSAKFGNATGARDAPRNGGDRMGDGYRMGGDRQGNGDRMGGNGGHDDRYPPSYDRGGYQNSREERGYGGGGGYDRPAPIYREERGREREAPRETQRFDLRGRSPPQSSYFDDRRGGGYDDRRAAPLGGRGRDEYPPQAYDRPREDLRRGVAPAGSERGPSYGSYGGGYESRPPSGGGYEGRGISFDGRGAGQARARY